MTTVPRVSPDLPSAKWRAILRVLKRMPQAGMSRGFGRIADTPIPETLRHRVLSTVITALGIDATEAELPLTDYRTINEFFVRRLKPGLRTWPEHPMVAASPVDAIVGQSGFVRDGQMVQAKGRFYTAEELLDDAEQARRFNGGGFITLYLSPRHYHRIHTLCAGTIPMARHVPGALLPVNEAASQHVDRLFARNERLICYVDGAFGRVAVVAIGAYNVGRISAAFDPEWAAGSPSVTNRKEAKANTRVYEPLLPVGIGDEIMAFHLGSTVVLLFEPRRANLYSALIPGTEVKVGEPIARGRAG
jgi:phosphatidylserine decarboxylase